MIELKPCPFCGAEAEHITGKKIVAGKPVGGIKHFVRCTECSAFVSGDTKQEAIAVWNRRAET